MDPDGHPEDRGRRLVKTVGIPSRTGAQQSSSSNNAPASSRPNTGSSARDNGVDENRRVARESDPIQVLTEDLEAAGDDKRTKTRKRGRSSKATK